MSEDKKKPTIAELEAILNNPNHPKIEMMPNGDIFLDKATVTITLREYEELNALRADLRSSQEQVAAMREVCTDVIKACKSNLAFLEANEPIWESNSFEQIVEKLSALLSSPAPKSERLKEAEDIVRQATKGEMVPTDLCDQAIAYFSAVNAD
jgi:hypothetical protein